MKPTSGFNKLLQCRTHIKFNSEAAGIIYIILAGFVWGLGGVFAQFLLQNREINTAWLIAIRLWVPGIILLLFCYLTQRKTIFSPWHNKQDILQLFIFGIFGMMASQLSFYLTILYSNAATATILQYLYPALIAVILCIYLRKSPSFPLIFSLILAFSGAFLIVTHGSFDKIILPAKAIICSSICIFASVIYTLYPIPLLKKYNTSLIAGWGMLIGGITLSLFHPFWVFTGKIDFLTILSLLFIVLVGGMGGFIFYLLGVKLIGSTKGSVLATVEPLAAAIFSVIILNVSFNFMDWLGTSCIIGMIIILAKKKF
ncbi:putative inner membrane transporter YicL [Commensalibacter sp. Nvir]|uniref:DMT family transporter n=1 Tax=Commensalibacter sp. Nvir TaxID=3069817 RepID=UPI002D3F5BF1|nr:putative inner membrane transporter YicL [Commensalibacter sp. Nvir]